jgi:hypothetical protein
MLGPGILETTFSTVRFRSGASQSTALIAHQTIATVIAAVLWWYKIKDGYSEHREQVHFIHLRRSFYRLRQSWFRITSFTYVYRENFCLLRSPFPVARYRLPVSHSHVPFRDL